MLLFLHGYNQPDERLQMMLTSDVDGEHLSLGRAGSLGPRPITGALGAEIDGVDLSQEVDETVIRAIKLALLEHGVVFLRDQALSAERHKAFARHFGAIFRHPNLLSVDPEIIEVRRAPGDTRFVGEDWHSDTTFVAEPPMGSILYGVDVPDYGGDTLWANQYLAFETLSDGLRGALRGMRALHSDRYYAGPSAQQNAQRTTKQREDAAWRPTESLHPVVRTHPDTGREALFVNRMQTIAFEGWTEAESQPLLHYLFHHAVRPEFTCRFRWRPGSLAFWDNRCTQHIAISDGSFHRYMRRVQICGDRPR
jgi:taurine dioxygenase